MPKAPRRRTRTRAPKPPAAPETTSKSHLRSSRPRVPFPPAKPHTPALPLSPLALYPATEITLLLLPGYPAGPNPHVLTIDLSIPCPAPLVYPTVSPSPGLAPLGEQQLAELQTEFLKAVGTAYNTQILELEHIQKRGCHGCEGGVGELYHHMVPVLAKKGGTEEERKEWRGKLIDLVVPICEGGGKCDRLASVVAREAVERGWAMGREEERRRLGIGEEGKVKNEVKAEGEEWVVTGEGVKVEKMENGNGVKEEMSPADARVGLTVEEQAAALVAAAAAGLVDDLEDEAAGVNGVKGEETETALTTAGEEASIAAQLGV
ncbi:hypothetical protein BJ508DRAFT_313265 [Ascobolus immersus RN42]|uniref:Uncharacterized protein n=1 Tax=Ascobolus immersus RN42 TaxID=1160509 RepID=A0A3N4HL91_ASCIM|nr:hypothetical protein BJ508DRAFT_313265 [Ascobolus immersus RN42]